MCKSGLTLTLFPKHIREWRSCKQKSFGLVATAVFIGFCLLVGCVFMCICACTYTQNNNYTGRPINNNYVYSYCTSIYCTAQRCFFFFTNWRQEPLLAKRLHLALLLYLFYLLVWSQTCNITEVCIQTHTHTHTDVHVCIKNIYM